jgi:hypothetical protein
LDPLNLFVDHRSPILAVIHPNNWVSGPSLWCDRVLPGARRTMSDTPILQESARGVASEEGARAHTDPDVSLDNGA